MAQVRKTMNERVKQLDSQIQGKLDQARERRENLERETKERLRIHVRFHVFFSSEKIKHL